MNRLWKNKNPKIKCCNCVFEHNCKVVCTYLSTNKYDAMKTADRVRVGFGRVRPKPIELKRKVKNDKRKNN